MKALVGLLFIVAVVATCLVHIRRERRSGQVHSHGRPIMDNILLFVCGIVLAGTIVTTFWWLGPNAGRPGSLGRIVIELAFMALAAGITHIANVLLRNGRKRPRNME